MSCGSFSDGLNLQPFDKFEVTAVVRQDREVVLERGRPDEQIEIANELAFFSQPPSLFPEALTDLFVVPNTATSSRNVSRAT
jgi:hypothetical protein